MSHKFHSIKLSKWQLALVVGAPLALGVSYYVYKKYTKETSVEKCGEANKLKETSTENGIGLKKKTIELENEKLTPLQEAIMYKNEGNACYRNGKYDEAIIFYGKAIDKCPQENKTDLAIFYQNRAAAYEGLRKWSKVKEDCTKSLECNPRYSKPYFRRAKAHESTHDISDCLDDITATCILERFQNNHTITYADRILKESGCRDAEQILLDQPNTLPSAYFITTYLRSFVSDPLLNMMIPSDNLHVGDGKLYGFRRAKKALDEKKYDEIIPACTEEIESSESESQYKSEALLLRGTFHLLAGSFNEARQDLDAVIKNADTDKILRIYALLRRASVNNQVGERDRILEDFEEVEKLQPDNPDLCHQRAQIFILLDLLPQALTEFEKALKLAPNNGLAYIQKCFAEYKMALMANDQVRVIRVMNDFRKATDKFPKCLECCSLLAQVLSDQQQFSEAEQLYKKAIQMAPDNASLYVHYAIMILQWKCDVNGAVELIEKAIRTDDKCALAFETLGTIEVQRANLQRAVELFQKAIQLSKSKSEIAHLCALRNAAIAQINVARTLRL